MTARARNPRGIGSLGWTTVVPIAGRSVFLAVDRLTGLALSSRLLRAAAATSIRPGSPLCREAAPRLWPMSYDGNRNGLIPSNCLSGWGDLYEKFSIVVGLDRPRAGRARPRGRFGAKGTDL